MRGVRFRIKDGGADADGLGDPSLLPVVPSDILPSVSRCDPRRSAVDVWTSGNRIFRCQNPHAFAWVAHAAPTGRGVRAIVEASLGRRLDDVEAMLAFRATRQIRHIVSLGHEEARRIGEG